MCHSTCRRNNKSNINNKRCSSNNTTTATTSTASSERKNGNKMSCFREARRRNKKAELQNKHQLEPTRKNKRRTIKGKCF